MKTVHLILFSPYLNFKNLTCRLCVCIWFYVRMGAKPKAKRASVVVVVDFCWWESERQPLCVYNWGVGGCESETVGEGIGWCACMIEHPQLWVSVVVAVALTLLWSEACWHQPGVLCCIALRALCCVMPLILFLFGPTRWAHYLDCYRFLRKVGAKVCPRLSVVLMGSVMCRLEPQAFHRAWSSLESWEICASESLHGLTLISGYVQVCVCYSGTSAWGQPYSLSIASCIFLVSSRHETFAHCDSNKCEGQTWPIQLFFLLPLGADWETGAVVQLTESQIGTSVIRMSHLNT